MDFILVGKTKVWNLVTCKTNSIKSGQLYKGSLSAVLSCLPPHSSVQVCRHDEGVRFVPCPLPRRCPGESLLRIQKLQAILPQLLWEIPLPFEILQELLSSTLLPPLPPLPTHIQTIPPRVSLQIQLQTLLQQALLLTSGRI
ncbi:uncharacterized protein LOC125661102 isoform X2 [Ostrea edulis]|uniref:uncharacterized protein LOC125661102 isoform X2 n=1 Tax=Ostrea edulis TaxID=37623 RepID=UPI0024AF963C|nr:uncharacterized protein LOC125661102 isoform X2 [Ostrea edulis]